MRAVRVYRGLLLLWAAVMALSVWFVVTTDPTGDGFTRGMNRVVGFLGFQFLAAGIAMLVLLSGAALPRGGWLQRAHRVPVAVAAIEIAALLVLVVWGLFAGR